MNWSPFYTQTDHFALLPALMLALFGCAVLLVDFLSGHKQTRRQYLLGLTAAGLLCTGWALVRQTIYLADPSNTDITAFGGALVVDRFSLFFNWLFLLSTAVVALFSYRVPEDGKDTASEYYGLLLLANCGMFFLASGVELITISVGLELMALCFYIFVGFLRSSKRSNEAALKYLLLGAFSTGFLLYGFSLLYGLAGSTKLAVIANAISARPSGDPIVFLAVVTCAVGLLFKIAAAPFHMWAPDAYEGAPAPVAAYLSVASKAASFALVVRMFLGPLGDVRDLWEPVLTAIALITLLVGNLAAISQTNVKRLLAYSSISHAGYILLGVVAGNQTGIQGVAVYLLVYTFMTLGAFLVVEAMKRDGIEGDTLDDLKGLMHRSPMYAIGMLVFLVSLAGIPPLAGFLGKYYIFLALVQTGHYATAIIAALFVAVSLYYYFRIVRVMFTEEAAAELPSPVGSTGFRAALAVTALMTVGIGLYPEPFLRWAEVSETPAPASATVSAPRIAIPLGEQQAQPSEAQER